MTCPNNYALVIRENYYWDMNQGPVRACFHQLGECLTKYVKKTFRIIQSLVHLTLEVLNKTPSYWLPRVRLHMYEWAGKGIDPYLLQVFLSSIKS